MKKKTLYKVLRDDMRSPFQLFGFEIGKKYRCNDFDTKNIECSDGFYATDLDGIIYSYINNGEYKIFECEVWGKKKEFDQFKRRYKYIKLKKELTQNDLKNRFLKKKYDIDYYSVIYPVNPKDITVKKIYKKDLVLLKKWASIWASVGASIKNSIWDSIWDSFGDSVRASIKNSIWDSIWDSFGDSVRDSICDSVGASIWASICDSFGDSVRASIKNSIWDSVGASILAYTSSFFTEIKAWKYIDHKEGVNPFQPCIDLWNRGLVPSFDGYVWRLHGGKNMDILWEGKL